jgi:hypothetical protein
MPTSIPPLNGSNRCVSDGTAASRIPTAAPASVTTNKAANNE